MTTADQPAAAWRQISAEPFPAAAALAVALLGNRRRRRPVPLGRCYAAATWWRVPGGPAAGIRYQDLPEPEPGPGGSLIATMGARFDVLATASGLYVRTAARDLAPDDLQIAREAIRRICHPDTLQRYAAAEVRGNPRPSCIACGRPLADSASRSRGMGPDCWQRLTDAIRGSAAIAGMAER